MALVCIGSPNKFLMILVESRSMGSVLWPVRVECKQTENKLLSPGSCHPGVGWVFLFRIIKKTPYRSDPALLQVDSRYSSQMDNQDQEGGVSFFILFIIYKIMTQENGDIYDQSPSHMDPVTQLGFVGQRA